MNFHNQGIVSKTVPRDLGGHIVEVEERAARIKYKTSGKTTDRQQSEMEGKERSRARDNIGNRDKRGLT